MLYRLQAHRAGRTVTTFTRRGHDWTDQFPEIAEAIASLKAKNAILDGEAVAIGEGGRPDFQSMRRLVGKRTGRLLLYAPTCCALDGKDLRALPLLQRKQRLQALLKGTHPPCSTSTSPRRPGSSRCCRGARQTDRAR